MAVASKRYSLLTLEKGLLTLEVIADTAGDIGLSELSARLDEPVSVVFRVLRTLVSRGYLTQAPITKRYSLGIRAWELGRKAAARLDVRDSVQPALNKLTRATGETASFAWVQGLEYAYIATADRLSAAACVCGARLAFAAVESYRVGARNPCVQSPRSC